MGSDGMSYWDKIRESVMGGEEEEEKNDSWGKIMDQIMKTDDPMEEDSNDYDEKSKQNKKGGKQEKDEHKPMRGPMKGPREGMRGPKKGHEIEEDMDFDNQEMEEDMDFDDKIEMSQIIINNNLVGDDDSCDCDDKMEKMIEMKEEMMDMMAHKVASKVMKMMKMAENMNDKEEDGKKMDRKKANKGRKDME